MDTKDFAVNQRGKRDVVKYVCAVPPHIDGSVLAEALVVKAIYLLLLLLLLLC